jgi:hypothetical protein
MIFLVLAALFGSAALLFYEASKQLYFGTPWAVEVCSASHMLCKNPEWLVYGAGGMIVLLLVWRITAAVQ